MHHFSNYLVPAFRSEDSNLPAILVVPYPWLPTQRKRVRSVPLPPEAPAPYPDPSPYQTSAPPLSTEQDANRRASAGEATVSGHAAGNTDVSEGPDHSEKRERDAAEVLLEWRHPHKTEHVGHSD